MENSSGVVDSPQETSAVEDASTNDLRNLLNQADTGAENPETVPAEIDPSQETDPNTGVSGEPTEEDRLAKRRIRPKSDLDQQVIDLYRSDGFQGSFQDASTIIFGVPSSNGQTPQVEGQPDALSFEQETENLVGDIRTDITTLTEQVAEAADNLDTANALNLQQQVMRKELEIQKLETRKEMHEDRVRIETENTRRQRSSESRNAAIADYPELGNTDTIYRKEFDNYVTQASKHPDYAPIFQSPKWPEILAREFGSMKGQVANPNQEVARQAVQQSGPQVGSQARTLTSGDPAQTTNAPSGPADIGSFSNEQLYSMLGSNDGQRHIR